MKIWSSVIVCGPPVIVTIAPADINQHGRQPTLLFMVIFPAFFAHQRKAICSFCGFSVLSTRFNHNRLVSWILNILEGYFFRQLWKTVVYSPFASDLSKDQLVGPTWSKIHWRQGCLEGPFWDSSSEFSATAFCYSSDRPLYWEFQISFSVLVQSI